MHVLSGVLPPELEISGLETRLEDAEAALPTEAECQLIMRAMNLAYCGNTTPRYERKELTAAEIHELSKFLGRVDKYRGKR